ncbi:MAG TPA: 16S rRNA (cytidine(1402)-2'-O)-methyltransferase [Burkholderiales bacterium]|nr:16S rRNA (cytidine(1402)-2'-O)-methyltransferase [Burkholderiales bacterium]
MSSKPGGRGKAHGEKEAAGSITSARADESIDQNADRPAGAAAGTLYVVATPIGNLQDISLRALAILSSVDVIAAEDTRNTAVLLDRHGIQAKLLSLHQHNESRRADEVAVKLGEGLSVAYVTDAGTPALSDPGSLLVERVRSAGFTVVPIPGPSAVVAALSVAGFAGTAFRFAGFLPERQAARRKAIKELANETCTLVFYEAPHRVLDAVRDLAEGLPGERDIVIARELTKRFESVHRGPLKEAAAWMEADADRQRGEFVLVVSGASEKADQTDLDGVLKPLLAELPLAQAVKLTCAITGRKRGEVYGRALALKPR